MQQPTGTRAAGAGPSTATGNADLTPGARCAAHPARPAHDRCPSCGRPRCAVDADGSGTCRLCALPAGAHTAVRPPVATLTATAASGTVLSVIGAALGQEYVGAQFFSVLFPALVGVVLAGAAASLAGPLQAGLRWAVAALVGAYAGVSALLDFRFTDVPFGPPSRWLPPLLAAVIAAVAAALVLIRRAAPAAAPAQDRKTISAIPPR